MHELVEAHAADQLLRCGFIKVDGPGPDLVDTTSTLCADAIGAVDGDTVHLTVHRDEPIKEGSGRDTAPIPVGALWWAVARPT
jgi:hypothetical protein